MVLICVWRYYDKTIAILLPGLVDTPSDFRPYHEATRHIVRGESPYLADGYIYPPLLAFLLTPLAPLDYVTARRVWFVISQIFLIAAAVLMWRAFGRDWAAACWIAFVWAMGGSATESLALGQVGPLLTLLVVLALTRDRWQQGAAIAVSFAIKLFPGLLGVAVVMRRERQAIRWMILNASIAVLLPWAVVAGFLKGPVGVSTGAWSGTPATLSWSLPSVMLRVLDRPQVASPLPRNWEAGTDLEHFRLPLTARVAALTTALVTLCGGLYALARSVGYRLTGAQVPWAVAALVALALAGSPVGWTHYQVLQYPGVALLLIHVWRQRQWLQLIIALALAGLLYPIPVEILGAYYLRYHAWTANSVSTLYIWTSVSPVASLALFALFVRQASSAVRR